MIGLLVCNSTVLATQVDEFGNMLGDTIRYSLPDEMMDLTYFGDVGQESAEMPEVSLISGAFDPRGLVESIGDTGLSVDPSWSLEYAEVYNYLDIASNNIVDEYRLFSDRTLTYNVDESTAVGVINAAQYAMAEHYQNASPYIPVDTPLWLLAVINVEMSGLWDEKGLYLNIPIDLGKASEEYMWAYDWHDAEDLLGNKVYHRSGGAIGPMQIESFYGKGISPIIPSEFGTVGLTDGSFRSDVWLEYGINPGGKGNIQWELGLVADRWSLADSLNITVGHTNTALARLPNDAAFYSLNEPYEMETLMMWSHNRGTQLLSSDKYIEMTRKIVDKIDVLDAAVVLYKDERYDRQRHYDKAIQEVCEYSGADSYPVMSLVSYLILEHRYSGEW